MADPITLNLNNQFLLIDDGDDFFVPDINPDDRLTDMAGHVVTEKDPELQKMMKYLGISTFNEIHVRSFADYVRMLLRSVDSLPRERDTGQTEECLRQVFLSAAGAGVNYNTSSPLATKMLALFPEKERYRVHLMIGETYATLGDQQFWGGVALAYEFAREHGIDIGERANRLLRLGYIKTFDRYIAQDVISEAATGSERYEILQRRLHVAESCWKAYGLDGKTLFSVGEQAQMQNRIIAARRDFYEKDIRDYFLLAEQQTKERPDERWLMMMEGALINVCDLAKARIPGREEDVFTEKRRQEFVGRARGLRREGYKTMINILVRQAMKAAEEKGDGWLSAMDRDLKRALGYIEAVAAGFDETVFPEKSRTEAIGQINEIRRDSYRSEIKRFRQRAVQILKERTREGRHNEARAIIKDARALIQALVEINGESLFSDEEKSKLERSFNPILRLLK